MHRLWLLLFMLLLVILLGSWGVAAAIVIGTFWIAIAIIGWLVKHVKIP